MPQSEPPGGAPWTEADTAMAGELDQLEAQIALLSCGDHGCVLAKRGGMGTNAGCRCLGGSSQPLDPEERVRIRGALHLRRVQADLARALLPRALAEIERRGEILADLALAADPLLDPGDAVAASPSETRNAIFALHEENERLLEREASARQQLEHAEEERDTAAEAMREACIAAAERIRSDWGVQGTAHSFSQGAERGARDCITAIRDLPVPAPAVPDSEPGQCTHCGGTGLEHHDDSCSWCGGDGTNDYATTVPAPAVKYRGPCAHCGGHVAGCAVCQGDGDPLPPVPASDPCTVCNGTGADCRHYPIQGCTCEVVPAPAADAAAGEREAAQSADGGTNARH